MASRSSSGSMKELADLMKELGIHSKPKTKSEMETLLQQQYYHITRLSSLDHQSKTVIVTGIVKRSVVTIYGETHNDIDNEFYKKIKLADHTVFVEHSTLFCELKPHEHPMFTNAKGSEWVWFTRTRKNQPVTCVDTRLECGFPTRYEEIAMYTMPLKDLLTCVSRVMRAATAIEDTYRQIKQMFDGIMSAMKRQFLMVAMLDTSNESHITVDDQLIDKDIIFDATRRYLISNSITIASLSVDMHIVDMISQHKGDSPISIFVGITHAVRLAEFMKLYIVTDDVPRATIGYDGDEKSENAIIAQLKAKK